jgi:hypothetical protein
LPEHCYNHYGHKAALLSGEKVACSLHQISYDDNKSIHLNPGNELLLPSADCAAGASF